MTIETDQVRKKDYPSTEADSNERYDLIKWRREQVLKMRAKGYTFDKIAETLKAGHPEVRISHGTVARDIEAIKQEVNDNLRDYIQKEIPYEVHLCQAGILEILREAWKIAESTNDEKVKISALSLAKDAYLTQNALLGDSKVLEQTIQWLKKAKKQLKIEETDKEITKNNGESSTSGNSMEGENEELQQDRQPISAVIDSREMSQ